VIDLKQSPTLKAPTDAQIPIKGILDLKEFAPHLIRAQSLGATTPLASVVGTGASKDSELVKII
jgi:hypothetical protein